MAHTPRIGIVMPVARIARAAIVIVSTVLAACGGEDATECSGNQNVYSDVVYAGSQDIAVGESVSRTPTTPGIPPACNGQRSFSAASSQMPPGLRLDPGSGTISGTPTQPGLYGFGITVTLSGFAGSTATSVALRVHRNEDHTYTGWTRAGGGWSSGIARLMATDTGLALVRAARASDPAELLTSSDGGATWTLQPGANAPRLHAVYPPVPLVSGNTLLMGSGTTLYRHDGTGWTVINNNAPVLGEMRLVQRGAQIFSIGARHPSRTDVSRAVLVSNDGGLTWQLLSTTYLPKTDTGQCAFALGNELVVIARRASQFDSMVTLWRSSDGAQWQELPVAAKSPLRAVNAEGITCAVRDGRAYAIITGGIVVSTPNLTDWQFETNLTNYQEPFSDLGSMAVSNGALYTMGAFRDIGRTIFRATP